MEKDRPLRLWRRTFITVVCLICLGAMWLLAQWPALVEPMYARRLGFHLARALSLTAGRVSMSVAEILLAGLTLTVLTRFVLAAVHVLRRRRGVVNALAGGVLRTWTTTLLIVTCFYLLWGLNYARAPLATRLGWQPVERPADDEANRRHVEEIAALAGQLVDAANTAYREATATGDLGRPSGWSEASHAEGLFDTAYERVQRRLSLEPEFARPRGRAKPAAASFLMNHLRLSGYYFPFTGEANFNRLQPASSLPHTVAHEHAHQRGIALEDEANFLGFLACVMSDDPYARYSGYLFAQRQLLSELAARDGDRTRALVARRLPGVQRDVDFVRTFWQQYEGRAARLNEAVNDRYLRAQGERRGTASYAASRSLIVLFARHNGGTAIVPPQ